jgi:HK97 family phage major capsid protein
MNAHVRTVIELPVSTRPVFAMAGETADIAALGRQFEAHNSALSARMALFETDLTRLHDVNAALIVSGVPGDRANAALQKEMNALSVFGRTGEMGDIRASMSVGSDPDGGWTVLPEIEKSILSIEHDVSPMRQLARVRTIASSEYKIVVNPGVIPAYFVGEIDARPQTDSPKLVEIKIPTNELYAMPAASQSMLDDSYVDVGAWLADQAGVGMAIKEGEKFTSGSGVNEPMGFLSYASESGDDFARSKWNTTQYIPVGSTTPTDTQLADALIALSTKLRAPYRIPKKKPTWQMTRAMSLRVRQLKDSTGAYIWSRDGKLNNDVEDLLCGFSVVLSENMPVAAANSFPIALAAWSDFYLLVDRVGMRLVRDPYSLKPYVLFYLYKRVGGGCVDFCAGKLLKWSAS